MKERKRDFAEGNSAAEAHPGAEDRACTRWGKARDGQQTEAHLTTPCASDKALTLASSSSNRVAVVGVRGADMARARH